MYYYSTQRYTGGHSAVPPTIATHKVTRFGDVHSFYVLRGGRVRIGNKIHSREEARTIYRAHLNAGWTAVN